MKDPVKRDFKLTAKTRYEVWLDQMYSELRARGLLDLVDSSGIPFRNFSEAENVLRRGLARDIIMTRLEESYRNKLVNLTDPKDIMNRIKAFISYLKQAVVRVRLLMNGLVPFMNPLEKLPPTLVLDLMRPLIVGTISINIRNFRRLSTEERIMTL